MRIVRPWKSNSLFQFFPRKILSITVPCRTYFFADSNSCVLRASYRGLRTFPATEIFFCLFIYGRSIQFDPWLGNEWINCNISFADLKGLSKIIAWPQLSTISILQFFTFSAMISTAERSRIWRKQKMKETTLGRSAKVNKVKVSL